MLTITIIGIISAIISISFILSEVFEAFDNMRIMNANNRGFRKASIIFKFPIAFKSLFLDVSITLGVVWLFSMGGVTGMLISLIASGIVSITLYIRKKRK